MGHKLISAWRWQAGRRRPGPTTALLSCKLLHNLHSQVHTISTSNLSSHSCSILWNEHSEMLRLYYSCWLCYCCLHHHDDFIYIFARLNGRSSPCLFFNMIPTISMHYWSNALANLIMLQITNVNVDLQSSVIFERAQHGFQLCKVRSSSWYWLSGPSSFQTSLQRKDFKVNKASAQSCG